MLCNPAWVVNRWAHISRERKKGILYVGRSGIAGVEWDDRRIDALHSAVIPPFAPFARVKPLLLGTAMSATC